MRWSLREWSLAVAVLLLVCSGLLYAERAGQDGSVILHYYWLILALSSATFFFVAYRTPKSPPRG